VTIFQTFTGLWLDLKKGKDGNQQEGPPVNDVRLQWLLNTFTFFNILQLAGIAGLAYLDRRKRSSMDPGTVSGDDERLSQSRPLLHSPHDSPTDEVHLIPPQLRHNRPTLSDQVSAAEAKRGKVFATICLTAVLFAWVSFLATSFVKIRSKHDREGH
jgi:hypothetical protein